MGGMMTGVDQNRWIEEKDSDDHERIRRIGNVILVIEEKEINDQERVVET